MDKVERSGLRICDMIDEEHFEEKLRSQIRRKNDIIVKIYGGDPLDPDKIVADYINYGKQIKKYVSDTSVIVYDAVKSGKKVLLEGAQGTLLDVDFGTYPYVTSSHPIAGGFAIGSGIGPNMIEEVLGITKAYTTRVGMGPFVTELENEVGDKIRVQGNEFGTTTGRARRCGWFDGVLVKYSARVNGMTGMALMLLDVLGGFDKIKICKAYKCGDEIIEDYPANLSLLEKCQPVYEELDGWSEDISGVKSFEELPENAKKYINRIEEIVGVKAKIVSVGPKRSQTIIREKIYR